MNLIFMCTVLCLQLQTGAARASCWNDPATTHLAQSLASRFFRDVAAQMPDVLLCDNHEFREISADRMAARWAATAPGGCAR